MGVYDETLNVNYDEELNQYYHIKMIFDNCETKKVLIVAPKVSEEKADEIMCQFYDYRALIEYRLTGQRVKYTRVIETEKSFYCE